MGEWAEGWWLGRVSDLVAFVVQIIDSTKFTNAN